MLLKLTLSSAVSKGKFFFRVIRRKCELDFKSQAILAERKPVEYRCEWASLIAPHTDTPTCPSVSLWLPFKPKQIITVSLKQTADTSQSLTGWPAPRHHPLAISSEARQEVSHILHRKSADTSLVTPFPFCLALPEASEPRDKRNAGHCRRAQSSEGGPVTP